MQKLGIFGGTFNPVHNAHLSMASHFVSQLKLDACLFVPAYISPFKTDVADASTTAEHRLKMLELAIDNNNKFQIDTYEIDKKGISYTTDTINYFKKKYPNTELYLLIGSDQLKDFTKWKDWEDILLKVTLCAVKRPDSIPLNADFIKNMNILCFIDMPASNISSSKIREMLKNNQSISGLVPKVVEEYTSQNKIYGS